MISKQQVRQAGKAWRAQLTSRERVQLDANICAQLQGGLDWSRYRRVLVFLPIERQQEIDLWPLVRWLWEHHPEIEVYVPVLQGETMTAARLRTDTRLHLNTFGAPEPIDPEMFDGPIDLTFIPLLGFDETGQRVGYGRGYFDRFLANQPSALRIGVAYEGLLVNELIAHDDHDIRLHRVVTERSFQIFNS